MKRAIKCLAVRLCVLGHCEDLQVWNLYLHVASLNLLHLRIGLHNAHWSALPTLVAPHVVLE